MSDLGGPPAYEVFNRLLGESRVRLLKLLAFLAVIILGIVFAWRNPGRIEVDYYFGLAHLPLALALVLVLGAGAVLGILATLGLVARVKRENGELRRKARLAGEELNNLRSLPIKDQ